MTNNDCLLSLLADLAQYKFLYSANDSFRKVKMSKVKQKIPQEIAAQCPV